MLGVLIPPVEAAPVLMLVCEMIKEFCNDTWQYLELLQHIHQPVKSHRIIKYYYDSM